jgi:UDP-N-acetylmuramate dehydrogenase
MLRSNSARCPASAWAPRTSTNNPANRTLPARGGRRVIGVSFVFTMTPTSRAFDLLAARLGRARIRRDVPLSPLTTFKIGGPADLLVEASSAEELVAVIQAATELQIPYFLLGLGANVLIGDRGFRGLVIRNLATRWSFSEAGYLWAESGTVIATLVRESARRGWSGLEHFAGIPSTVGGALWQNLHFLSPAPARERTVFIAEVFDSAELIDRSGLRHIVGPDDMKFGYDTSRLHSGFDVVLAATFRLSPGSPDMMERIIQENLSWRGARHPWLDWYPSAGSIFRKIEGRGAGRLIDEAGLKGFRQGGAQISPIHANIIVNLGSATAQEVRQLITIAQNAVEQQSGVHLTPEIGFIGEF